MIFESSKIPTYVIAEMYAGMAKGRIKITLNVFLKGKLKKHVTQAVVTPISRVMIATDMPIMAEFVKYKFNTLSVKWVQLSLNGKRRDPNKMIIGTISKSSIILVKDLILTLPVYD